MKISINLTEEEVEKVKVLASKANVDDIKEYINLEFHAKVLRQKVGTPQINKPAGVKMVTGPSWAKEISDA